jgi:Flp pilus assembly protein TadD
MRFAQQRQGSMHRSQRINNHDNSVASAVQTFRFFFLAAICAVIAPISLAQFGMGRLGGGEGGIQVDIVTEAGTPMNLPALVSLSSEDSIAPAQQISVDDGIGRFAHVSGGRYRVSATIPGYKDGSTDVDVLDSGVVDVTVTMSPDNSGSAGANGIILAPKAKKELEEGVAALHASQFDQAQEDFEAAYKLAPGDPDVNDALGVLFLARNDLNRASEYLGRALSLDPQNINALVNNGQLRLMQHDADGAQVPLQKAVAIAPRDTFAHWLLGAAYLDSGQFEKARVEALAAIKTSKGIANGAGYILGEALAGLGRNGEAVEALQKFVREFPRDTYAESARALISKLQGAPALGAAGPATQSAALTAASAH